jgi:hypothetical protein
MLLTPHIPKNRLLLNYTYDLSASLLMILVRDEHMKKRYLNKDLRNILQAHLKDEADAYIESIKSTAKQGNSWLVRLKNGKLDVWNERGRLRNLVERLG